MATSICDFKLAGDLGFSCESPAVKGLKNAGFLFNYDDIDWDACTYDSENPNVMTLLKLKTGARGYNVYMPGKTPFTGTKTEMAEGTYRNKFTKDVAIVLLDSGPDVAHNVVDNIANGKFVAVLENEYQGEDKKNTFEVYGSQQGLKCTSCVKDMYSDDTDGGWAITLQEANAPTSAIYYFKTGVTETRTSLEGLTTVTSAGL